MNSPIGNQLLAKVESCEVQNFDSVKQFVLDHIIELERKYSKKWKEEYLVEWIYNPRRTIKDEKEIAVYNGASLHLAIRYFKNLVEPLKDYQDLNSCKEHISSYIYDMAGFVEFFERKTDNSYIFFTGNKFYYTESHSIRRASENLFWQSPIDTIQYQKIAFILSVMTLRQCIEIRFKRICGIERVYPKSGGYISSAFFPEFIKNNLKYFEFPPNFSFPHILKVYNWTHEIVHNGFQPLIWQVKFALDFTRPLFSGGSREPHRSVYGAVTVKNRTEMQNKLTESIVKYFDNKSRDSTVTAEDIELHWLTKPEAIDEEALIEENHNSRLNNES